MVLVSIVKALLPIGSALLMLIGQANPFVQGQMTLTQLDQPSSLFGSQLYLPGGPDQIDTYRLRLGGPVDSTRAGLYVTNFDSRAAGSSPVCTAPDPSAGFDITITEGGDQLYQGTLSALAQAHSSPQSLLPLASGHLARGSVTTVSVALHLDQAAGNDYMGCSVSASLAWYAAQ